MAFSGAVARDTAGFAERARECSPSPSPSPSPDGIAVGSETGFEGRLRWNTGTWYEPLLTAKHDTSASPNARVTSPAHAAPAAATAGASSSVTTIARAASLGHPREVYGTGHTPTPGGASK